MARTSTSSTIAPSRENSTATSTETTSLVPSSTRTSTHGAVAALRNVERAAVADFLGPLGDLRELDAVAGVLATETTEGELGETTVALVAGDSAATVTAQGGAQVLVEAAVLEQLGGQPVVLSLTSFSASASQWEDVGLPVSISLWSLSSEPISLSDAVEPLEIRLPSSDPDAECVFWDEEAEAWSSQGLSKMGYEEGFLLCASSHLTIFSTFFQEFALALRCSTAPALLSPEGLAALGRFPHWLGYGASLFLVLSIFCFALCMGLALGHDRAREQTVTKEDLVFLVRPDGEVPCQPLLRVAKLLGMEDSFRDLLSLHSRLLVYEAVVSRCIRMLHSHKAGVCWDSLRLIMIESTVSRALSMRDSFLHRTRRQLRRLCCRCSSKVQPSETELWHHGSGVHVVEGFLSSTWAGRVYSLAPALHPWLRAVQSSLFSSHASRAMLLYLKLSTAGAVNALFFQGSAYRPDHDECREPETPYLQAMRAVAIGVGSALLGDLLILVLWKVQKRPAVLHEPWSVEAEERELGRWHCRLRVFWGVAVVHCCFCIFYVITFLANVTEEDSQKWLQATMVSLLEDLVLLPLTLAMGFGTMVSILLYARPEVKESIRSRWLDETSESLSQGILFTPAKRNAYQLEEAAGQSLNLRVESVNQSQGIRGQAAGQSLNLRVESVNQSQGIRGQVFFNAIPS